MDEIIEWLDDKIFLILTLLFVFLIVVASYAVVQDEKRWNKYSTDHHCVAKGIKEGQTSTGVGTTLNGKGEISITVASTPDQTIYVCDDGEIQIR